jgi:3-hydroxyacyl-CoA dehydrogenase / enoyl-CoA hydratase / 3-hydroxybutyryl-CoA epimerase / enoyl-CoA isomerase
MGNAFRLEETGDQIALLTFDLPDARVNTMGRAVREEFSRIVDELAKRNVLKGLLLASGKPKQFIAGADLHELGALVEHTTDEVRAELNNGHDLFGRLSRLPFPTVALINGHCMGGGTELVLAMDERLVASDTKAKIALPEVKVGLIPGWGGTQRMPRLVGINQAIKLITSGEPMDAAECVACGFAFDAVPDDQLVEVGKRVVNRLHESGSWKETRKQRSAGMGLSDDQIHFAFACAEGQVLANTKGHYPAPPAALKAMQNGVNLPLEAALEVELDFALEVTGTPINANLVDVFFMQTALAKDSFLDEKVAPRDVTKVGVLGAGLMGSGIATAHARSGLKTAMVDIDDAAVAKGLASARKVVESRMAIGRATTDDLADLLAHLGTSTSHEAFKDCDVVIEAVPENEALKTKVYRQLAPHLRDDAILATNTSTISVTRMAKAAPNAERFVGLHFFYPVDRMALVEIIRGKETSDETVATLVALSRKIRKTPIVVGDCPGFLVNRVLLPYMNEALLLLVEGADMDRIDKAATRFGFPMGPIALHDFVGLDTCHSAGQVMCAGFGDRAVQTPLLGDLVEAGRLGKKTGKGIRQFVGPKQKPAPDPEFTPFLEKHRGETREHTEQELVDRLLLPMLLEATRILAEGIVREPAHVDMGLILGIGFPPFRGGLLHWADDEGAENLVNRCEKYADLGERFVPTDLLVDMARGGKRFFPRGRIGE